MKPKRALPNVLITGTPGVGKSTLAQALTSEDRLEKGGLKKFEWINIGEAIREHHLYEEWDDDLDVSIFSERLVKKYLKPLFSNTRGGLIVDFHSASFLPPEWFDLVIVVRATTETLFDRLQARGYTSQKITENIQSEIFQVVQDEIVDAFGEAVEIWIENSNTVEDLNRLVDKFFTCLSEINFGDREFSNPPLCCDSPMA